MEKKVLGGICCFFSLTACEQVGIDPTPPFDQNNRHAILIDQDCNSVKRSVGLSGCAFTEGQVNGNMILPALWTGSIEARSQNCKNFTLLAEKNSDNVMQISDMYTTTNGLNCSFEMLRTLTDGDLVGDNLMLGRFFIKILPNNKAFKKMRFEVNREQFDGVGWIQKKFDQVSFLPLATNIVVRPSGTKGIFRMSCDGETVIEQEYATSPFTVKLESNTSCDYEMSARSSDSPNIDFGTLMHEVTTPTIDLTPPSIRTKYGKITFTFPDRDASGRKPVVVGVRVNNTACRATHKCTVAANQTKYFVQGFTLSARSFYGYWHANTSRWEILGWM